MNTKCNKCGTNYDSPCCPNCGTPAQKQENNQHSQQLPPQMLSKVPSQPNQYIPYQNIHPAKRKHGCLIAFSLFISISALIIFAFISACIGWGAIDAIRNPEKYTVNEDTVKTSNDSNNIMQITIEPTVTPIPTKPPTPTPDPYIHITSTELIESYESNQVKCKKLYDKQLLEVTGTVQSVGTDILDNTYVCLGSDTEYTFVGIQCYAKNEDEVDKIAELKEGDYITIIGKGNCGSLSFSLDNSEIID